jgi:hypothetical protein
MIKRAACGQVVVHKDQLLPIPILEIAYVLGGKCITEEWGIKTMLIADMKKGARGHTHLL